MRQNYYFIGIIMYPYKYGYGQYRVIFPSVSIWRLPVLWFLTKILLYVPIEEYNVYSLGNWAMPCWSTSDALSFPLNLQYNSLPIEKAARTPYSPQSMYLILSIFTLLFHTFIESNSQRLAYIAIYNPTWVIVSYWCLIRIGAVLSMYDWNVTIIFWSFTFCDAFWSYTYNCICNSVNVAFNVTQFQGVTI